MTPEFLSLGRIREIAEGAGARVIERFGHALWEANGLQDERRARTVSEYLQRVPGVLEAVAGALCADGGHKSTNASPRPDRYFADNARAPSRSNQVTSRANNSVDARQRTCFAGNQGGSGRARVLIEEAETLPLSVLCRFPRPALLTPYLSPRDHRRRRKKKNRRPARRSATILKTAANG